MQLYLKIKCTQPNFFFFLGRNGKFIKIKEQTQVLDKAC